MVGSLGEAGATWTILVPAGPADRVNLLAETLVAAPGRREQGR
jgi:hypothetical protein